MALPTVGPLGTAPLDTFDRANEGPPPSADWTTGVDGDAGGMIVSSGAMVPASNSAESSAYWNADSITGAPWEAWIGCSVGHMWHALYGSISDPADGDLTAYVLGFQRGSGDVYTIQLDRVDGGGDTELDAWSIGLGSPGSDGGFAISHDGEDVSAWRWDGSDWLLLGSYADTPLPDGSVGGVYTNRNGWSGSNALIFRAFGGGTSTPDPVEGAPVGSMMLLGVGR